MDVTLTRTPSFASPSVRLTGTVTGTLENQRVGALLATETSIGCTISATVTRANRWTHVAARLPGRQKEGSCLAHDSGSGRTYEQRCAELASRLRTQRPGPRRSDPRAHHRLVPEHGKEFVEQGQGRFAAVAEAVDHALAWIEHGERLSKPAPPAVVAQARRAARQGVAVETVLQRYHAGQGKLQNVLIRELDATQLLDQSETTR